MTNDYRDPTYPEIMLGLEEKQEEIAEINRQIASTNDEQQKEHLATQAMHMRKTLQASIRVAAIAIRKAYRTDGEKPPVETEAYAMVRDEMHRRRIQRLEVQAAEALLEESPEDAGEIRHLSAE